MKRFFVLLLAAVAMFAVVPAANADSIAHLTNIRTGRNIGYDRVVLDLTGPQPGTSSFVTTEPANCASGKPISVSGNEFLEVHAQPAATYDDAGNPTYTGPRKFDTPGLTNVRGVAITCDFEADLGVVVGYERPGSAHSVFFLQNPLRLVIDIKN
ncbi:hypothetical protein Lesp02_34480 [Lentzea sp. NBRC 105346]|uniref:AMIN-like domain-containing (lipo)protein n=1 Tax=Lentzea sp. NBRC 105346 TaxID=3032205 RepID=UPI0024A1E918|nr:hypothetical protein [Lentzea sp. NBRC 105346]GLZ31260.1 hypothetical protein Lesp02_34480 [Lentzea sp. NBRC 105346]